MNFAFEDKVRFLILNCCRFENREITVENLRVFVSPVFFFSGLDVEFDESKGLAGCKKLHVFKVSFEEAVEVLLDDFSAFLMEIEEVK